jgi:hypothetical protein
MYGWIAVAACTDVMPIYCLAALLTVAVAWRPMMWAWKGGADREGTVPALASNVVTNLATQTLLGAGFIAGKFW